MISLADRVIAEEQMDALDLSEETYAAILSDLARVNALTMAARPTLRFMDAIAAKGGKLRVLDVGFGHGDMLRRIAAWGDRNGVSLDLVGIDLNPRSERIAREATGPGLPIAYRTGNYVDLAGEGWDAVISSLVAHHMASDQLVAFLRFMEAESARGWFVNDLHRLRLPYAGYPLLARVMGWHRIVREDGTLSIARSFRREDWQALLEAALIRDAEIVRRFPFRLCVSRVR